MLPCHRRLEHDPALRQGSLQQPLLHVARVTANQGCSLLALSALDLARFGPQLMADMQKYAAQRRQWRHHRLAVCKTAAQVSCHETLPKMDVLPVLGQRTCFPLTDSTCTARAPMSEKIAKEIYMQLSATCIMLLNSKFMMASSACNDSETTVFVVANACCGMCSWFKHKTYVCCDLVSCHTGSRYLPVAGKPVTVIMFILSHTPLCSSSALCCMLLTVRYMHAGCCVAWCMPCYKATCDIPQQVYRLVHVFAQCYITASMLLGCYRTHLMLNSSCPGRLALPSLPAVPCQLVQLPALLHQTALPPIMT